MLCKFHINENEVKKEKREGVWEKERKEEKEDSCIKTKQTSVQKNLSQQQRH